MKPRFLFYYGHTLTLNSEETTKAGEEIFDYKAKPLATAFVDDKGRVLTPNKKNRTNLCSIPKLITVILGFERWRYQVTAVFHDNVYNKGGLWQYMGTVEQYIIQADCEYVFVKFTRSEGDDLLKHMIPAEAEAKFYTGFKKLFWEKYSKWVTAPAYWAGVRIGGWACWNGGKSK